MHHMGAAESPAAQIISLFHMWVLEKTFSSCQCSSWEMNQWRDLAATTDRSPSKVDSAETRGRGRAPATQVLWGRTKEEVAAGEKLVNSAPTPRREIRWRKLQVNSGEAVGWESNNINNKNRNDKKWGMNASPPTGRLFCSYSCRLGLGHLCFFSRLAAVLPHKHDSSEKTLKAWVLIK